MSYDTTATGLLFGNKFHSYDYDPEGIISTLILVLFLSDFALGALLLVQGHKRKLNLLRAYYFYSIGMCLLTVLLTSVIIGISTQGRLIQNVSKRTWTIRLLHYTGYFVNMAMQAYFVLLIRKEIMNCNKCLFIFTNNTSEAECMTNDRDGATGKKEIEVKFEKERLNLKICQLEKQYI